MTTSYEKYIRPDALPAVAPLARSQDTPDEQFFIRTHQAFEVWFAQILTELEFVRSKLSAVPVPEQGVPLLAQHIRRAAAIFGLLHDHLPLLETLLTTDFFDFRGELFGAGGTESYRYREVEWLMGFRDPDLLEYLSSHKTWFASDHASVKRYQQAEAKRLADTNPHSKATRHALEQRASDIQQHGTLRRHLLEWLRRTPYPGPEGSAPGPEYAPDFAARFALQFREAYESDLAALARMDSFASGSGEEPLSTAMDRLGWFLSKPERSAIVFILQFSQQPRLAAPAELLEAALELDEAFLNWRDRHIEMVARVIGGGRISTTGSAGSGLAYLRGTTSKRAFPEIWDARSFLLGHAEASGVYQGRPGDWHDWRHFRLAFEVL